MRLTGGLDRGRHLIAPRGARTRPTASKVRQALFNILGPPAGPVLDLYHSDGFYIPGVHSRPVSEKDPDIAPALLPATTAPAA